ncbi:NADH:ubiquinone oxidoreductase [Pseudomonas sp. R5(2019)]|uniref:NADH:ubiquinone oxidoreductase n=1 Tax=Pseudomonas sp. R5(2019) TaxID=2697566 RepID=UPI0014125467|nr:NADH:ubiquinone oxidoreductase [Pseudomonas sp. R5(2019)]NBA97054.1 NADH:ubiquinone oxidoreductase [Pseudomonas sp. R5(2019)]
MRTLGGCLLMLACTQVHAEACVVHSSGEGLKMKVCQQNRTIPQKLFHDGFCQPTLPGQQVSVEFVDQCPFGSFGVCSDAHVDNMPYRQDIHYYGVASDARYLKPFCEQNSKGLWITP